METEAAYFHRRAFEERQRSLKSASVSAKLAHLSIAQNLESLARAVEAEEHRAAFYDVNVSQRG